MEMYEVFYYQEQFHLVFSFIFEFGNPSEV